MIFLLPNLVPFFDFSMVFGEKSKKMFRKLTIECDLLSNFVYIDEKKKKFSKKKNNGQNVELILKNRKTDTFDLDTSLFFVEKSIFYFFFFDKPIYYFLQIHSYWNQPKKVIIFKFHNFYNWLKVVIKNLFSLFQQ